MKFLRILLLVALALQLLTAAQADDAKAPTAKRVANALVELDRLARQTLEQSGVPGIGIAVVHNDQVAMARGFGVRAVGRPEPIDADTVFQAASVSKPLATTVLAALVGQGRVSWDDRVIDRDPEFRLYDPAITRELRLRDLLCHRSGLPDHCGDWLEDVGYPRTDILFRLRYQPLDGFRAHFAYTNFGFTEGGVVAAKAVGKSWEDVCADALYTPLGMKSTSSRFEDYARAENRALLHARVDGKWAAKNVRHPDAQSPAGGVSTTLNDIARWLQLQLAGGKFEGRQVVDAAALAETRTPQIVTGFDPTSGRLSSYGLGWIVSFERGGRAFCKHSGEFSLGMRTEVALLPSESLGIAVMSNAAPSGIPEGLTESFFDWVLDGKLERDWMAFAAGKIAESEQQERAGHFDYTQRPSEKLPPIPLAAYVGNYSHEFFGRIEVAAKDDKLVLLLGPNKQRYDLRHWNRDVWYYDTRGEMANGTGGAKFLIGPSGVADSVTLDNLGNQKPATFLRVAEQ